MEIKKSLAGYMYDCFFFAFIIIFGGMVTNEMFSGGGTGGSTLDIFSITMTIFGIIFCVLFLSPLIIALVYYFNIPTKFLIDEETITIYKWFRKDIVNYRDMSISENQPGRSGLRFTIGVGSTREMICLRIEGRNMTLEAYRYEKSNVLKKELLQKIENRHEFTSFF